MNNRKRKEIKTQEAITAFNKIEREIIESITYDIEEVPRDAFNHYHKAFNHYYKVRFAFDSQTTIDVEFSLVLGFRGVDWDTVGTPAITATIVGSNNRTYFPVKAPKKWCKVLSCNPRGFAEKITQMIDEERARLGDIIENTENLASQWEMANDVIEQYKLDGFRLMGKKTEPHQEPAFMMIKTTESAHDSKLEDVIFSDFDAVDGSFFTKKTTEISSTAMARVDYLKSPLPKPQQLSE